MCLWQKLLLSGLLVAVVAVIVVTWGSIGSAALLLSLFPATAYLLLNHFHNTHDPEDYQGE